MTEIVGYDGELPSEGEPVFNCDCCGEPIYSGEEFTLVDNGMRYCNSCTWLRTAYIEDANPYVDLEVESRLEDGNGEW